MQGWIKLHRKFLEWEWFNSSDMVKLFIFLLISANHEDNFWHGIEIKKGQYLTGLKSLSVRTNISEQKIRTCLKRLEKTGEINRQSTNKFSIITICNYESYQSENKATNKQKHKQLTNNQQATNNKQEYKNEKNKFIYNEFYDEQIELSKNDKYYVLFVKWLFGENIYKRPLEKVINMKEQVTWKQFPSLLEIHNETGVKIRILLEELENWLMKNPKAKNSTVLGTLRTFANRAKIEKK